MELELKEIRERPLIFFIIVAFIIHIAAGFAVYTYLQSDSGKTLVSELTEIKGVNPNPQKNPDETPIVGIVEDDTLIPSIDEIEIAKDIEKQPEELETSEEMLPPFEKSPIISSIMNDNTFIHEKSGLLFADEIRLPDSTKEQPERKKIVPPKIHREFNLTTLPREYRYREWDLTLHLKVNKEGDPIGRIRVVKSSGDKIVDELTRSKVQEARFEPAHYEGSTDFFDYEFNLDIHYD